MAYLAPIYELKGGDECNADGYFNDCNMQKRVFHNDTFESLFL